MTVYKLGTGLIAQEASVLVLCNDNVYQLSDLLGELSPTTLEELFADWLTFDSLIEKSLKAVSATPIDKTDIVFKTPISNPRKVVCIGTNYHDHLREMKVDQKPEYPYAFMRPQTCLSAHGDEISLPKNPTMIDWEAELAVIIGTTYGPENSQDPMTAVAGYTVVNDLSARDWIHNRPFVGIDWVMQKSWNQFQPTGPWITPSRFVDNPEDLDIQLTLNDEVKQKSSTRELIFSVRDIITHLAGMMTLEPGDIIATGTPAGVGFGRQPQEFIQSGDRIAVTIEGLGTLENTFK